MLTDPVAIKNALNAHWQEVFNPKDIDQDLLEQCLQDYNKRAASIQKWTILPSHLKAVIKAAKNSSPGPDGIPFLAYKVLQDSAYPVLWAVLQSSRS